MLKWSTMGSSQVKDSVLMHILRNKYACYIMQNGRVLNLMKSFVQYKLQKLIYLQNFFLHVWNYKFQLNNFVKNCNLLCGRGKISLKQLCK